MLGRRGRPRRRDVGPRPRPADPARPQQRRGRRDPPQGHPRSAGPHARRRADTCANYLLNKRGYLDYPTALQQGWPIATGVIEGACRHLVNDRMDLTGARWGLAGAEAIGKLRALRSNGDLDQYWAYHLTQEQQRIHNTRYADGVIPTTR